MRKLEVRIILVVLAAAAAVGLGGCIIVVENTGDGTSVRTSREVRVERERVNVELAREVRDAILADAELRDIDIRIYARGSEVTLRGEVASAALRDRAIDVATMVQGVTEVESRIVVRGRL